ncbi:hypothetical protein ALI144C_50745 [Actinosynnema sp. ALI-1.44]|uniref:hypothetical protein n=1 Tax=Actinosynnema sp. ALI-1.44 TaxID=1933779 RepID=UPI00097CA02E|nr:hypothetical protein [Actinosynnema sp. ALI-1.44]ONI70873.1 hypothetical protein ALI144C_50745 [Actinosynnema sp. ALI-1.44]
MKRLLTSQWRGLTSLWLWVRRRRAGVGPSDTAIGYARDQVPTLSVLTGALALESFVVGLLVPWWWVHVLDVLTLLQVLGIAAVMVTRPHCLTSDTLVLREGSMFEVRVPLASIASARVHRKDHNGPTIEFDDDTLSIVIGNQTDVTVVLSDPLSVKDSQVSAIRFRADDPREAVRAINDASRELATNVH